MIEVFIPPPEFIIALASCLMLPIFLVILSNLKLQALTAKHRFISAVIAAPTLMVTLSIINISELVLLEHLNWINISCACLLYGTAVMIFYCVWALIGYGFTVSILMNTYLAERPLETDELIARMANNRGLLGFTGDRAEVLLRMQLVTYKEKKYKIAGLKALQFSRIVGFAMDTYSINSRKI
jgi:hypothetical protein